MHTIETINYIIMCLFFVCYAYQFAYIPLAWLPARKRQTPKPDPDHTFAVLIAAHDEATVIGALVDSLCAQTYPAHQIGIFVAADGAATALPRLPAPTAPWCLRAVQAAGALVISAMKDLLHFEFGQFWLLAAVGLGVLAGFAVAPHCIRRWIRKAPGAVTYAVLGMMLGSLYAIVVGPATLKVPQHVMTLSDFHILWFVLDIAVMLGLEALKKHMQKVPVH